MSLISLALLVAMSGLLLVAFTLISQNLEQRRAEKRRLAAMLERRIQQLQDLLLIPTGYLSTELEIFIHQSIIDGCIQLSNIDRKLQIKQILPIHQKKVLALQSNTIVKPRAKLDNPAQLSQIKASLKDVHVLITNGANNGFLPRSQALRFRQQLSETILQLNLAAYQLAATHALESNKFLVALHYYEQAQKVLSSNPAIAVSHTKELAQYEELIRQLNERILEQASSIIDQQSSPQENEELLSKTKIASSQINTDDEDWKKKQIYD